MTRRSWLVAAGAVLGVAAWYLLGDPEQGGVLGDVRQLFTDAISGITQGTRLTRCPYDKTTGVVPCDPQALADQAGATLEEYALARNIASEEGSKPVAVQALIAHATKNHAARSGLAISALLLRANNGAHAGYFGTQKDIDPDSANEGSSDRYASTALDPYDGHLAVARGVLDGSIPDLTGGADQYDEPGGEKDPDAVAAKRLAAGQVPVQGLDSVAGIGSLRFWKAG